MSKFRDDSHQPNSWSRMWSQLAASSVGYFLAKTAVALAAFVSFSRQVGFVPWHASSQRLKTQPADGLAVSVT